MTRLPFPDYLSAIRTESARFREVLADCDPAARVPACPDWSAADLLWHVGGEVQHFWAEVVVHRPRHPREYYDDDPPRPTEYGDLLAGFDQYSADLVRALAAADPADQAWSWAPDQLSGSPSGARPTKP